MSTEQGETFYVGLGWFQLTEYHYKRGRGAGACNCRRMTAGRDLTAAE